MILKFPDLDTLRLALITGAVPPTVSSGPVKASTDESFVWAETSEALPRGSLSELKKLGVQSARSHGGKERADYCCWAQLLPLQRDTEPVARLEQAPVLFQMDDGEQLAKLAIEILRLGNDRQVYRWLEEEGPAGATRALLRVIGPPYYSLLRAIDRKGKAAAPVAFLERAPGVWVELGWTHPLAVLIKPPEGRLLLLRPAAEWTPVEDLPFRDIYEVMELTLGRAPSPFHDADLPARLQARLSLKQGGTTDAAELWVLRDNPVEELNQLVQNADDHLLNRLSFAVGEKGGQKIIVVRVRQSKQQPPVLVLRATGYRPYLKISNLFLPVGTRLHPPLRRDKVRQLLADDSSQVVWLAPAEGGGFTPESLPEDAFRPLWDWVEYVLDHEQEPLQAWMQAMHFDFEPFICDEEQEAKPRKPATTDRPARGRGGKPVDLTQAPTVDFTEVKKGEAPREEAPEEEILDVIPVETSELRLQLSELEDRFIALEGGLDEAERIRLWPQLADLNAALGNGDDSGVCWSNALWWQQDGAVDWSWRWFRTESALVPGRPEPGVPRGRLWTTRATLASTKTREVPGDDLDRLLQLEEPATADLRALAAYLVWAARRTPHSQALLDRLGRVQQFLEDHERLLPVRFAWLAWFHLTRLSGGDVLALARARDRLLERLFHTGLRPEQDLPSFLRFAGQPTSQRFRAVRQWLAELEEKAQEWVAGEQAAPGPKTPMDSYVRLIFAFGLGRLGEVDACRGLLQRAKDVLGQGHDVHQTLLQAFEFRIRQALEGKPHTGPLPTEFHEYLEHMDRMPRYVVDRLRQHSRVLEPDQKIDPYRHWGARISDLDRALAELVDIHDRNEIVSRVTRLLKDVPRGAKGHEQKARILRAALDLAPRVSEELARTLLDQTPAAYDALPEAKDQPALIEQASFLEKGLTAAAHFDRIESIHPLVTRFQRLLQSQKGERAVQALESLAGQCFRGLRKLGMREEIDQLLTEMANLVLEGRDVKTLDGKQLAPAAWRALLHVAGGWYYFGRDSQADRVIQAARTVLFKEDIPVKERTSLACTYAATVGQAHVEVAQKRLEELFARLQGIRDTYTTNTYYSLSQLDVVEAVVSAVVSDDFTLGSQARRWLDDDEYLVRKRIHRDVRSVGV